MKIKALASIIEFDEGRMVVLNEGDEGELSEALALQKIGAGVAEEVNDEAAALAPSSPQQSGPADELKAARGRYAEVVGKNAYHAWSIEQLNEKIAAFQAEAQDKADADAAPDQDGETEAQADDAPPSEDGEDGAPA